MAFGTLSELLTALQGWLGDRTDLVDQLPNFVALAEEDMSGKLRARELHDRVVALLTEEYEWLPVDFAAVDYLAFGSGSGDRVRLPYRTMQQIDNDKRYGQSLETPCVYSIIGTQIRFAPPPTPIVVPPGVDPDLEPWKARHFELVYWRKVAPLTAPASTNVVLTNYPSCYLYGSLVAAEPFILNDARLGMWKGLYEEALDRASAGDKRDTHAAMVVSMPGDAP
jgi:hypothetical protein